MLFALAILLNVAGAKAQKVEEYGIFDHLGVGISVGTTGIGFDLAAPVTDYLQLRAGYSFMPKLSYTAELDVVSNVDLSGVPYADQIPDEVDIEGKLNMNNFKFLIDIYPFKASRNGFHVTAGAFIGSDKLVSVYNTTPFTLPSALSGFNLSDFGLDLADYGIAFDKNGYARADLKVKGFKPYLGIGYGRAVPKKRLGVQFDMGVQFWGKPGVYRTVDESGKTEQLKKGDFGGEEADEIFDIMEKITVYPVIKLRLCGRIF